MNSRRVHRGIYFFEWFALLNLGIALFGLGGAANFQLRQLFFYAINLAGQAVVAVAIRALIAHLRHDRGYVRRIRTIGWITDTLRIVIAGAITTYGYLWVKLMVPIYHPRVFDQELWDLDQKLLFGLSPNILLLNLFSGRTFLRLIDFSYAGVFFISMVLAWSYFLSEPSRRLRVAFSNGHAMLWIFGAWLYMLVPSLGPAYRFPDVWFAHASALQRTQHFQALLMRNYNNVLRFATGARITESIQLFFGIGAFPSLHVGFQTFAFLWMRKLWKSGQVIFAVFVLTIFLGSMLTGWHYLIDALAGIVLAGLCYFVSSRRARIRRWLKLRSLLRT